MGKMTDMVKMTNMAKMTNMVKRTKREKKAKKGTKWPKIRYLDSGCKNVDQLNLLEVAYLNVQALELAQPVHGGTYWRSLEGRGGRPVEGSKLSPSPYADALVLGYIDKNGTISDAQGAFVALKNDGIASSKQH